jgi:sugar-specific transcriptional regulator TrmB
MQKELQQLGFTEKEARAYAALAGLGTTTIGAVERKTRIHKQMLYPLLEKLRQEGVVGVTLHNGRKHFSIADPDILRSRAESQRSVAESLVPIIYAEMGTDSAANEIKVYKGVHAVQTFFITKLKQMPERGNLDILGAGGEAFMSKIGRPGLYLERYDRARIEKKISQRMLMYENQRDTDPVYIVRRFVETRYLPEKFRQPTATHIWPDSISMLFFDDEPRVIEIKSAKIAESFRNYFEMLWKMSKE